MRVKYLVFSIFIILCLFMCGACKNGTPTAPDTPFGLEFSGQITQAGSALAGVDVYLSWGASQKTTTGSDGKFSFTNLGTGSFIITPSKVGYAFSPSNFEVSSTRKDLNFTASAATYGTEVGSISRDFTAKDQSNNNITLSSYHGKVILMDFTADWCGPCRLKAETAEQFYQKYKDKGFIYILIVIEGSPSVWASTYGLTFPVLNDNSQAIYNQFKKANIPLPHVLDRNRTIKYKKEGWDDSIKSEIENLIQKLL